MFRLSLLTLCLCFIAAQLVAQDKGIVFNKTEHDFGTIAPSSIAFEQDFLFRNTTEEIVTILTVRSVSPALSFIHTRSEVLSGEYGFVKAKLKTEGLDGLFHDEIYVTFKLGNDVKSEVIYIRAQIDQSGTKSNGREFQDSEIAASVEVSPADIETMEGFMGKDQLTQAESEISYLKKQVAMKSELIAKLSADIQEKQVKEVENIQRLNQLERTLQNTNTELNPEVIEQIGQLSERLNQLQNSGQQIQNEIAMQEAEYDRLRRESDSARAHASELSRQLSEQFQAQAKAMNLANKLAYDLERKEKIEKSQRAQIDSLQKRLADGGLQNGEEIEKLRSELEWRLKEQKVQEEQAKFQDDKIKRLNETKELLALKSDSLEKNLTSRSIENEELRTQLAATDERINAYERRIDSLNAETIGSTGNPEEEAELAQLKRQLEELENRDRELKTSVIEKDQELASLEEQREQTQKNLKALEAATNRQLDETHELMYRVKKLSQKEIDAQNEIGQLQKELETSHYREEVARTSLKTMTREISMKEESIKQATDSLASQERQIATLEAEQNSLESRLENALMSNEIAFEEIKSESMQIQRERDSLRLALSKSETKNKSLTSELQIAEHQKRQAEMVIEELDQSNGSNIHFEVSVMRSKEPFESFPTKLGSEFSVYRSNGGEECTVGHYSTMKAALNKAEELKAIGYQRAHVIAFKNGERISMQQALDTAGQE